MTWQGVDVSGWIAKAQEAQRQAAVATIAEFYAKVVKTNPVDTGYSRHHNSIMVDDNLLVGPTQVIERERLKTEAGQRFRVTRIGRANINRAFKVGSVAEVFNVVDYMANLEAGSSSQAPDGVYRAHYPVSQIYSRWLKYYLARMQQ